MEANPIMPRQRQRRTERAGAEAPMPQETTRSVVPVQPVAPIQQMPQQPMQPGQIISTTQPLQQPAYQPPLSLQAPYPPVYPQQAYPAYPQQDPGNPSPGQMQLPVQPRQPVQQPQAAYPPVHNTVQYTQRTPSPRPRVLEQRTSASSGWETPVIKPLPRQDTDVPHARQAHGLARQQAREARQHQREEAAKARKAQEAKERRETPAEAPVKRKLPGWMTTLLSLMIVGVLGLVAAYSLMQAYLTTQANERQAAYEKVLSNYHVMEQADGTLHITWQEEIEKYAALNNLQPAFVAAIIRNESSFRTNAESNVGARGLMQLMSDTAQDVAGMLGDDNYHFDRMYDGESNIRYGCRYLRFLCELFGGDPTAVAAAYNAGLRNVQNWLMDRTISPDGVSLLIDKIPFGDTRDYVRKVTQAYGIYQKLLYPDETLPALSALPVDDPYRLLAVNR